MASRRANFPASFTTRWSTLLVALAIIIAPRTVLAHPESFSSVRLILGPSSMHVTLILPVRDLSRWFPPGRYKNYTADVAAELGTQAADLFAVAWDDQVQRPGKTSVHPGLAGFIVVEADYSMPKDAAALAVRAALLANLPNDHQQVMMLEDGRGGTERIVAEQTLTAQQDTFEVDLPTAPIQANPLVAANGSGAVSPKRSAPSPSSTAQPIRFSRTNAMPFFGGLLVLLAALPATARYLRRRGRERPNQVS